MAEKPVILAVNQNRRNLELLSQFLGKEGYQTLSAVKLDDMDRALDRAEKISLVLIDLAGFDQTIWERCDRLRNAEIPFLIISPKQLPAVQQASLAHGAKGVLFKPLVSKELLGLIRSLAAI